MSMQNNQNFAPENLAQAINPWSWWFGANASDNQNSLINVTTYKSGNPRLEHKIIHEVAGYGMQLGLIEEMIELLLAVAPDHQLSAQQKKAIKRFEEMRKKIAAQKEQELLSSFSVSSLADFTEKLSHLKESNPKLYARVSAALKEAISG